MDASAVRMDGGLPHSVGSGMNWNRMYLAFVITSATLSVDG